MAKAFVTDIISKDHHSRAYGIYNAVRGVIVLPARYIVGFLWDKINPAAPFYFGAGVAAIAVGGLYILTKVKKS